MTALTHRLKHQITATANRVGLNTTELAFAFFMVFAFLSGVQAHLLPSVYPVTRLTTDPLLLVICGPLLWLVVQRQRDKRLWWWALITYVCTFFIEALGVATGAVFGAYTYGDTMWAQWLGVPLVIAINWTLLILATNDLVGRFIKSPILTAVLASMLLAAYDFVIEPVAIKLDYWTWVAGDIPLQNYLAWAGVALVFSLALQLLHIRFKSPLLLVYWVAQLLFFILLNWLF